jgi:hypothetical protein
MPIHKQKRLKGSYQHTGYYGTKSQCQGEAKLHRKRGRRARVVRAGKEYTVLATR